MSMSMSVATSIVIIFAVGCNLNFPLTGGERLNPNTKTRAQQLNPGKSQLNVQQQSAAQSNLQTQGQSPMLKTNTQPKRPIFKAVGKYSPPARTNYAPVSNDKTQQSAPQDANAKLELAPQKLSSSISSGIKTSPLGAMISNSKDRISETITIKPQAGRTLRTNKPTTLLFPSKKKHTQGALPLTTPYPPFEIPAPSSSVIPSVISPTIPYAFSETANHVPSAEMSVMQENAPEITNQVVPSAEMSVPIRRQGNVPETEQVPYYAEIPARMQGNIHESANQVSLAEISLPIEVERNTPQIQNHVTVEELPLPIRTQGNFPPAEKQVPYYAEIPMQLGVQGNIPQFQDEVPFDEMPMPIRMHENVPKIEKQVPYYADMPGMVQANIPQIENQVPYAEIPARMQGNIPHIESQVPYAEIPLHKNTIFQHMLSQDKSEGPFAELPRQRTNELQTHYDYYDTSPQRASGMIMTVQSVEGNPDDDGSSDFVYERDDVDTRSNQDENDEQRDYGGIQYVYTEEFNDNYKPNYFQTATETGRSREQTLNENEITEKPTFIQQMKGTVSTWYKSMAASSGNTLMNLRTCSSVIHLVVFTIGIKELLL